jgi:hypothetical protein
MLEEWGMEIHLIASTTTEMDTSRRHAPTPPSAITVGRMAIEPCHAQPRRASTSGSVGMVC